MTEPFVDVNETTCAALGYTKEQLLSNKVDSIFTLATPHFPANTSLPFTKNAVYGC
jgi:hypothetical protein